MEQGIIMTQQMRDKILRNSTAIPLVYAPLDAPPLPNNHPRIRYASTGVLQIISCCWRGYQGTWEIKTDGRLYLIALDSTLSQLQSGEPSLPIGYWGLSTYLSTKSCTLSVVASLARNRRTTTDKYC
jgi:hypothetical protein